MTEAKFKFVKIPEGNQFRVVFYCYLDSIEDFYGVQKVISYCEEQFGEACFGSQTGADDARWGFEVWPNTSHDFLMSLYCGSLKIYFSDLKDAAIFRLVFECETHPFDFPTSI